MNYQNHSKHRKIRHWLWRILGGFSFSFLHLPVGFRFVLLGDTLTLLATFFPWFSIGAETHVTPYSGLLGFIGFIFVLLSALLLSAILSSRFADALKSYTGILLSDHSTIVFFGVTKAFLVFVSIAFMKSLVFFTKDLEYHNAPVYAFVGAFLIVLGWALAYREAKREVLSTLYIENSQTSDALFREYEAILSKKPSEKKNMSLPV